MKSQINAWLITAALALTALALPLGCGVAAAKPTVNPAGRWKLAVGTNSQTGTGFQPTLSIRREGGKLVGGLSHSTNGRVEDRPLEDVRLEGSNLFFTVTVASSGGGPPMTRKYRSTISGDTIKGQVEIEFGGETRTRDWEAKRVSE